MALHDSNPGIIHENLESSPKTLDEEYPESNESKFNSDERQQDEKPEDIIKKSSKVMERHHWGAHPPKLITMLTTPVNEQIKKVNEVEITLCSPARQKQYEGRFAHHESNRSTHYRTSEGIEFACHCPSCVVKKVVLTWTETEQCMTEEECVRRVQDIQLNHLREEGVPDIKHNFLLGGDGALYEGRGFTRVGQKYPPSVDERYALTEQSIEIAFIDKCRNHPSPTLLKVLSECLAFGVDGQFIEPKFSIYWMAEEDVIYIQPTMLKCKGHT